MQSQNGHGLEVEGKEHCLEGSILHVPCRAFAGTEEEQAGECSTALEGENSPPKWNSYKDLTATPHT